MADKEADKRTENIEEDDEEDLRGLAARLRELPASTVKVGLSPKTDKRAILITMPSYTPTECVFEDGIAVKSTHVISPDIFYLSNLDRYDEKMEFIRYHCLRATRNVDDYVDSMHLGHMLACVYKPPSPPSKLDKFFRVHVDDYMVVSKITGEIYQTKWQKRKTAPIQRTIVKRNREDLYVAKILTLFAVDFGFTFKNCDIKNLWEASDELLSVPCMAIPCRLNNVEPTENNSWDKDCIKQFKKELKMGPDFNVFSLKFMPNYKDNSDRYVGQILATFCHQLNLGDKLVANKFAKAAKNPQGIYYGPRDNEEPSSEEVISDTSQYLYDNTISISIDRIRTDTTNEAPPSSSATAPTNALSTPTTTTDKSHVKKQLLPRNVRDQQSSLNRIENSDNDAARKEQAFDVKVVLKNILERQVKARDSIVDCLLSVKVVALESPSIIYIHLNEDSCTSTLVRIEYELELYWFLLEANKLKALKVEPSTSRENSKPVVKMSRHNLVRSVLFKEDVTKLQPSTSAASTSGAKSELSKYKIVRDVKKNDGATFYRRGVYIRPLSDAETGGQANLHELYMVDYGYYMDVSEDNFIEADFSKHYSPYSPMALKCCLYGLLPNSETQSGSDWSYDSISFCKSFIDHYKEKLFAYLHCDRNLKTPVNSRDPCAKATLNLELFGELVGTPRPMLPEGKTYVSLGLEMVNSKKARLDPDRDKQPFGSINVGSKQTKEARTLEFQNTQYLEHMKKERDTQRDV